MAVERRKHLRLRLRVKRRYQRSRTSHCDPHEVSLFELPKNPRLLKVIGKQLHETKVAFEETGVASRVFHDFEWSTKKSWSGPR